MIFFPLHGNAKEGGGGKHSPSLTKREPSGFDKLETIQVCATVVTLCKCHFPLTSEAKISQLTLSHGLGVIPCKMTTNYFIINKLAQKSSPPNLISGQMRLILQLCSMFICQTDFLLKSTLLLQRLLITICSKNL